MLQLNDYTLPRHQQAVSLVGNLENDQLDGETSGSESAHKGIKPKELNVSFVLSFDDADKLGRFFSVAEAIEETGDPVIYDITERTANAVKIRQVKFSGRIECREMPEHKAWRVNFKLVEFLSVAEKTEQRQVKSGEQPQTLDLAAVVANVDTALA